MMGEETPVPTCLSLSLKYLPLRDDKKRKITMSPMKLSDVFFVLLAINRKQGSLTLFPITDFQVNQESLALILHSRDPTGDKDQATRTAKPQAGAHVLLPRQPAPRPAWPAPPSQGSARAKS